MLRAASRLVVLATLALAMGCQKAGPERVAVEGQVTLDGRPLELGSISFIPNGEAKGPKSIGAIVRGQFKIPAEDGPLVGPLRVQIRSPERGPLDPRQLPGGKPSPPAPAAATVERIPDCYNYRTTLTAIATSAGPNQFTFPLVTKPNLKH